MATQQKLEQVRQKAEDLFIEEGFGQIDGMSIGMKDLALIDLRDPFQPDDRFAPIDNSSRGFGSLALKNGISDLAAHDVEVQNILKTYGVVDEAAPHKFLLSTGDKAVVFLGKDNVWRVTVFVDGRQQTIKCASATSRDSAMVGADRWLASKRGPVFNELTEEQKLTVSRMCTQGQIESALMTYIYYKIGEVDHDVIADPRYLPAMDEAAFFIFYNSTTDFVNSQEFQDYLSNFRGDRPLTVPLIQAAYSAFKEAQKLEQRDRLLFGETRNSDNQPESNVTYEQLDELDTEEIERLRRETLRLRAKQVRSGILQ